MAARTRFMAASILGVVATLVFSLGGCSDDDSNQHHTLTDAGGPDANVADTSLDTRQSGADTNPSDEGDDGGGGGGGGDDVANIDDDTGAVDEDAGATDDDAGRTDEDEFRLPDTGPAPTCVDPPAPESGGPLDCSDSAGSAVLPQNHDYQVTLRNYMACLGESDFEVAPADITWDAADYGGEMSTLHHQWIALRSRYENLPNTEPIRVDGSYFTLDAIEQGDTIKYFGDADVDNAFWVDLDVPGNPFRDVRALRLRAFVTAAVDMMMLDQDHEAGNHKRSDFLGANVRAWAFSYKHFKEALPMEVRQAFEAGVLRHLGKLEDWGITNINTNMDAKAVAAFAEIGQVICDDATKQRTVDDARTWLFGSPNGTPDTSDFQDGIFQRAGYVGEANGPETTYNGLSLFSITQAAMITRGDPDWDPWMQKTLWRMTRWKLYQSFPEPDGLVSGPSSYAKRTAAGVAHDQASARYRDMAIAMLTDAGLPLLRHGQRGGGIPTADDMEEDITELVGGFSQYRHIDESSDATPEPWRQDHWGPSYNFTYAYYVPGSYQRFQALKEADDPNLELPFSRDISFDLDFNGEFWSGRADDGDTDWGFFVETIRDAGWGYNRGPVTGGGVAEFWTEKTGTIIRGKSRGNSGDLEPRDDFHTVDNWAANHIWGIGKDGMPFSTGKNRETDSTYDVHAATPTVTVAGAIGKNDEPYDYARWTVDPVYARAHDIGHPDKAAVYEDALEGPVNYERSFTKLDHGLEVTSRFNTNNSQETVTKLWENIPIQLYDDYRQEEADVDPRGIEFRVDGDWQEATSDLVSADAIRVTRYGEHAYIVFDHARDTKLADSVWTTEYQSNDHIQVVHIDMLEGAGPEFDQTKSITWTATVQAP